MYYREKRWKQRKTKNVKVEESLELLDVRIFPITIKEKNQSRKQKTRETAPKQKSLNDKRSKEYFTRLVHCNFDQSDYVIHATFTDDKRPLSNDDIDKEFKNYIKRINRRRKKEGLENARYIAVTEGVKGSANVHFHIIIDGDLNRDILEDLWNGRGFVNVDRLQINEEGLTALIKYMTKEDKNNSKKWRPSLNLKKPKIEVNDSRFKKRKVLNMLNNHPSREELENLYPGYSLTYYKMNYNQEYGNVYIDIKLRKYVKNEEDLQKVFKRTKANKKVRY